MTPQQTQLNTDLPQTEVFKNMEDSVTSLKQGQNDIKKSMEEEKNFIREEFNKGSEKFEQIEGEMKEGFEKTYDLISSHIQESKDNKITKLTSETQELKEELQSKKTRSESVKDGVIIVLVGGILLALCIYGLSLLGISVPK